MMLFFLSILVPKNVIDSITGPGAGTIEISGRIPYKPGILPPVVYVSPTISEKIMTEYVAGKPLPIENSDLIKSIKEFAAWNDISRSLSTTEGKIVDLKDLPNLEQNTGKIEVKAKPEPMPDVDDVSFVEINPGFDAEELRRSIVYPQMALQAGVTGKVIVRVLIDKTGKPLRTTVFYSESEMLDREAIRAVMSITYTPAIQNGMAVPCWLNIPVNFIRK